MRVFRSFRGRLVLLVVVAALPALALLALNNWNSQRLQAESAYREAARFAALIASQHDRLMAASQEFIRTLVLTDAMREPDPAGCAALLGPVARDGSVYAGFARLDAAGDLVCSSGGRDWPVAAADMRRLATEWRGDALEAEPFVVGASGRESFALVARAIAEPGGRPAGFLVTALRLDWLSELFGVLDLPVSSTIAVLDPHGTVLMRYPEPERWIGTDISREPLGRALLASRNAGIEIPGLDGIARVYGVHRLGGAAGVVLTVGIPVEEALRTVHAMRNSSLAALLLAIAGVVLATWFASRSLILRWIDRIRAAARTVTVGQYAARVGGPYDDTELGELARTFDTMLDEVARREAELQEREEWFRSVVQHSTDMISIVDGTGRIIYLSPAVERVLGFQPDRLKGESVIGLVHPAEQMRFGEVFKYLAAQPNRVAAAEHRLRHAEGHYVFMESIGVNLLGNPAVHGIVVNSRDVTRRRRVEEMLRLVTSAVDQSLDGILITTAPADRPEPEIVYANPTALALTGYEEHELIGATPRIFGDHAVADTMLSNIQASLQSGEESRFEVMAQTRGRRFPMAVQVAPLKDDAGRITHFVIICSDVTDERRAEAERERLEATLRQALKMEAVGTLAGGIAHDFNNVLLPMMMLTQLTLNRLPADSRERQDLGRVLAAQKRAKALVGQILAFSRGSSGEYVDVDLAAICRETLNLLRASLPATVTLVERLDTNARIQADPTQVQQVLMNLCSNAAQAMPSGKGTITVTLDEVTLRPGEQPEGTSPGRYCRMVVADDGSGIPPGIVERIFDPFFTTKEVGVGTGLGLSVVHGIVTAHRGAIMVQTEVGRGTAFTILLPMPSAGGGRDAAPAEPLDATA